MSLVRLLGLLAQQSRRPAHTTLDTSASRVHDREEDLQAASAKIGSHLFEHKARVREGQHLVLGHGCTDLALDAVGGQQVVRHA